MELIYDTDQRKSTRVKGQRKSTVVKEGQHKSRDIHLQLNTKEIVELFPFHHIRVNLLFFLLPFLSQFSFKYNFFSILTNTSRVESITTREVSPHHQFEFTGPQSQQGQQGQRKSKTVKQVATKVNQSQ